MRHLTAALVLALGAATAGPVGATTDTDTCRTPPAEAGTAPATDIICFALNLDCVDVVGTLRVRSTDTTTYPTTVAGSQWTLSFQASGVRHEFVLTRSIGRPDSAIMHVAGEEDQIPVVSITATTITWSVPRSATAALRQGGVLTELTATAKDAIGHGWERTAKDSSDDPARTPTCR